MSKKVLVISASPRKGGNSDLLCDSLIQGAEQAGHTIEKVFLADKKISYCTGCGVCNSKQVCVQKDDMATLLDSMLAANVIVMATPIYFYAMNGQLKTFIDRCCTKYTQILNKEFYFIMTAADAHSLSVERTMEGFRGFMDCLDGAQEKGTLYATQVWQKGDVQGTKFIDQAYQIGKSI